MNILILSGMINYVSEDVPCDLSVPQLVVNETHGTKCREVVLGEKLVDAEGIA